MYCRAHYSRKRKGLFHSTTSENHILYYSFPLMFYCTNGIARRSVQYYHSLWKSKWGRVREKKRAFGMFKCCFSTALIFILLWKLFFLNAEILMVWYRLYTCDCVYFFLYVEFSVLPSLFVLTPPAIVWHIFSIIFISAWIIKFS